MQHSGCVKRHQKFRDFVGLPMGLLREESPKNRMNTGLFGSRSGEVRSEGCTSCTPVQQALIYPVSQTWQFCFGRTAFFVALFPAELGGTTTGTAGRTVCKSCTAHHKKSPDQMAWGSWWSILHSTRTRTVYSRYCGRFHEPRRIR